MKLYSFLVKIKIFSLAHNYLVDNLLSGDPAPVKKKLMCQFVNFFQKLRKSPLREVRILASLAGRDRLSVSGKNLAMLEEEFGLDPWTQTGNMFKGNYKGYSIPADKWRLPLLQKLLTQRRDMVAYDEEVENITELKDSLCST